MAEYSEDEFRDMRGMTDGTPGATWRPPPLLTVPPANIGGRAFIAQDSRRDLESSRRLVLDRFTAHWEGTIDGDFRATIPIVFSTVESAIEWGRRVAPTVVVGILDEAGRRHEFTAGDRPPSGALPRWPPEDPHRFRALSASGDPDVHESPAGAALSSWFDRPDADPQILEVRVDRDRATVLIVDTASGEPPHEPDEVRCVRTSQGWTWESSRPAAPRSTTPE